MATEKEIWSALKTCYDPEIPVNIVDLGLVYELKANKGEINIKMTLTSPACPLTDFVEQEIKNKLTILKGIKAVNIEFVWDPPWSKDKMSATAKRQLDIA